MHGVLACAEGNSHVRVTKVSWFKAAARRVANPDVVRRHDGEGTVAAAAAND
jgi:hypothetical protein